MPSCLPARDDVAVWRAHPDTYSRDIQPCHVDHRWVVRAGCACRTVDCVDVGRCESDGCDGVYLRHQSLSWEVLRCRTDFALSGGNAFRRLFAIERASIAELYRLAIEPGSDECFYVACSRVRLALCQTHAETARLGRIEGAGGCRIRTSGECEYHPASKNVLVGWMSEHAAPPCLMDEGTAKGRRKCSDSPQTHLSARSEL